MRIPQRVATYGVPALMVAVAVLQGLRVASVDQSTWSGAGYGMFATVDNEDSRFVVATLIGADGSRSRSRQVPSTLARRAFEARVVPSQERVDALAAAWLATAPGDLVAVEVAVWGVRLVEQGADPQLGAHVVRRGEARRDGPPA